MNKPISEYHFGVPAVFRQRMPFPYPEVSSQPFEEWYYDNLVFADMVGEREFLPVFWNGYHVRNNFGEIPQAVKILQDYIDGLDRSKRYYAIHQFDLGPMVDFKDLDIVCFGMSAGRIDVPIPLTMMPHPWNLKLQRGLLLNFIGRKTHPLREILFKTIKHGGGNYIAEHQHASRTFCEVIAQSTFTLCPRGYGPTSFRIYEALQYGSIPVYISDEFVQPFNIPFGEYGVAIKAEHAHKVEEILRGIQPEGIERKQKRGAEVFKEYFTYEGCKKQIIQWLSQE